MLNFVKLKAAAHFDIHTKWHTTKQRQLFSLSLSLSVNP